MYNMSKFSFFINIIKLMRVKEWWSKLLIIIAAEMIIVIWNQNTEGFFGPMIFMFVYLCFVSSYGYVINAYFDRIADEQVNKFPVMGYFTKNQQITIIVILGLPALLMPCYYRNLYIVAIGLFIFLLTTFYSAPPLRFKERSLLGPLVAALVQRPLPFYFFTLLIPAADILTIFLFGWLTLIGLAVIFGHQLLDFENDLKTGVKTMAQSLGFSVASKLPLVLICGTVLYISMAPFLYGLIEGIALSLVLSIFSISSGEYVLHAFRKSRKYEN